MGKKKWTDHLAAPTSDVNSPDHRVLEAFGKVAVIPAAEHDHDWADRDYASVKNEHWKRMVAEVLKEYVGHGNTVTMELHARRLVLAAVAGTFAPEEDDDEDQVDEDMSDAIPATPVPAEDSDDQDPTPRFNRHRRVVPAVSNQTSSMNKRGRDWHNTEITGAGHRFDMGVKNTISVATHNDDEAKFEDFSLIMLVVKMFGSVVTVPAGYSTSLAQVIEAAQCHKGNPLGKHKVCGGLRGTSAWAGLWDNAVWKKAKMEARSLQGECWRGNPTCVVYHVEFVVLPDPVVIV